LQSTVEQSRTEQVPQEPLNSRRNFVAFATDMLGFMVGLSFIPATIVLVGMASRLTTDKALLGVVAMTGSVAWFLPQIVAARIVHGKRRQKPYLVIAALIGRQAYLIMAIWLLVTRAQSPLLTVFVLIACIGVFHVCDSLAGVAWFDILSRALSPRVRGRSIAIGNFVGLAAGLGSSFMVERILSPNGLPFPTNYAVIFICAWVSFMISFVAVVFIQETPMSEVAQAQSAESPFSAVLMTLVKTDSVLQRLLLARVLTGIESMAAAFYVVFIRERLQLPESVLGIFAFASVAGGLGGLALFGLLADRFGPRTVIHVSTLLQVLAPVLAFTVAVFPAISATASTLAFVLFIWVIAINGAVGQAGMLGFQVYPLDTAPERQRAMYIGVLNSAGGVVSLTPVLGGLLIDWLSTANSSSLAYSTVFGLAMVCVAAGLVISLGLPKPSRAM
ncbi:MAG: MFS transporter, partial [Chloroflexi bacterium]|nr:MFS transporter [Chloroflexota bacterium]